MKKTCLPVAVLLALSLAAGCNTRLKGKAETTTDAGGDGAAAQGAPGPPLTAEETLTQQAINLLNRATELMKSIRDRASATAAAPELKGIALQLQDLNRRGVPFGMMEIAEKPEPLGRFRADMEKAVQRYADIGVRLLAQEDLLGPEFQAALREFGKLPQ